MKLPFPFLPNKEQTEYILAVLLGDEKISVVIFEEAAKKIKVVSENSARLSSSIENVRFEELLEALDTTISTAEETLPPGSFVQKTVFGVKENWTQEAKIKKEYLVKLKKISEELDLKPIGFLVFAEAIVHLLQREEGAPVSALLIETGKNNTTVSLIRAGKITETKSGNNEHGLTHTVDALLKHFVSVEILPSRIILFHEDGNEKIAQAFIGHAWSRSLPFLHVPQVSVLPQQFDTKAVLFATAAQLGFDVSNDEKTKGIFLKEFTPKEKTIPLDDKEKKLEEKKEESKEDEDKDEDEKEPEQNMKTRTEELGFAINTDVANTAKNNNKHDDDFEHTEQKKPFEEKKESFKINTPETIVAKEIKEIPEEVKDKITGVNTPSGGLPVNGMLLFSGIKKTMFSFFAKKHKHEKEAGVPPPIPREKKPRRKIAYALPVILLLLIGGVVFYMFAIKATVTLFITPKVNDQNQDIVFSTKTGSDFSKNTIKGSVFEFSEDDSESIPTTGTKDTGDSAKGTVTIYNKLTDSVALAKGTVITSTNSLKFTLDQSVTVASASGASDPTAPTTPGTVHVSVTANSFGTEYNLPSNTKFTLSTDSSIAAKNDNPFSGGTKKQLTIVAKDDLDKLTKDLETKINDKAKKDLGGHASSENGVLATFIKIDIKKKNFDKKTGDEAKNVVLAESISYQAVSYDKKELLSYTTFLMKNKLPSDATLMKNGISYEIKDAKQIDDTTISATLLMHARLLPKLNTSQIAQDIKGSSFDKASNILSNKPQVSRVVFTFSPNIFLLPKILPRNEHNITVSIKNDE